MADNSTADYYIDHTSIGTGDYSRTDNEVTLRLKRAFTKDKKTGNYAKTG